MRRATLKISAFALGTFLVSHSKIDQKLGDKDWCQEARAVITRRATLKIIAFALGTFIVSCAKIDQKLGDKDWYREARAATTKAYKESSTVTSKAYKASETATSRAYTRMQRYLAKKDLLAGFHDAGEHSEEVVLRVLRRAGMTGSAPVEPPSGQPAEPSAEAPQGEPATPPAEVPEKYAGTLNWPVAAGIFSSEFGLRWGHLHKGIDIAADIGEPVHAIADGVVIYAGNGLRGYGNVVILRHDSRMSSLYAHNSALKVKQGDLIKRGEVVALLGNTGRSTGPHVHFEIREGEVAVNPRTVMPIPDFGTAAANDRRTHSHGGGRSFLARVHNNN